MATAKKTCRICGKEYDACRSAKSYDGVFNWREVACSTECGMEYLELVTASRSESEQQTKKASKKREKAADRADVSIADDTDEDIVDFVEGILTNVDDDK